MQVFIGVGTSELNSESYTGLTPDIHCSKTLCQLQFLPVAFIFSLLSISHYLPFVRFLSNATQNKKQKNLSPNSSSTSYCPFLSILSTIKYLSHLHSFPQFLTPQALLSCCNLASPITLLKFCSPRIL